MRKTITTKVISALVASLFLFNNIAYGLSPMPGSTQPATKDAMYALGQKLFAAKRGPGAIDFDAVIPVEFVGNEVLSHPAGASRIFEQDTYGTKFVKADYSNPPKAWKNNPILQETDMISAFRAFRDKEAKIPAENLDIKEGYFPVDEERGELPISRIEKIGKDKYVLIIHTRFVQMWNHIRKNDVWFEVNLDPNDRRTLSVAWGIFYRVAKHEMADLRERNLLPKSVGHIHYEIFDEGLKVNKEEVLANMIQGRYGLVNDAIWMWFLGSYAFSNTTRYNNETFLERLKWMFESHEARNIGLPLEFPYLKAQFSVIESDHLLAMAFACAINYNFFNRPGMALPRASADSKFMIDYYARETTRMAAGITEPPMYTTGSSGYDKGPGAETQAQLRAIALRMVQPADGILTGGAIRAHLRSVIAKMVPPTGGILAADESTSSAGKRLESVGLPNTPENRRKMRELMLTVPGQKEAGISAVILFDETFDNADGQGRNLVQHHLLGRGILPGIKTDRGLVPDPDSPGEMIPDPKGLEQLPTLLDTYSAKGAVFTKWRVTIAIDSAEDLPTEANIRKNMEVLALSAKMTQEAGLVPIVEPEVLLNGAHDIKASYKATTRTLDVLFEELNKKGVWLDGVVLKTGMILSGDKAANRADSRTVGYQTLKGLLKTVPAEVPAIVFLSGGQGDDEVNENLNGVSLARLNMFEKVRDETASELETEGKHEAAAKLRQLTQAPWEISYSFGRGLQRPGLNVWKGKEENFAVAQETLRQAALITQKARLGWLDIPAAAVRDMRLSDRSPGYFKVGDQLVVDTRSKGGFGAASFTKAVVAKMLPETNQIEVEIVSTDGILTGFMGCYEIADPGVWKWDPKIAPFVPKGKSLRKAVSIEALGLNKDLETRLMFGDKRNWPHIETIEKLEQALEHPSTDDFYHRYSRGEMEEINQALERYHREHDSTPSGARMAEAVKPAPDMQAAGEKSAAKRPGKRQPGKSHEDAKIAIALSPTLKKLLETQGWFTLKDFLVGHQEAAEAHPELNWTSISEDQARTDLEALATDDGTGSVTTATVTIDKEDKAFKYSLTFTGTNAIADLVLAMARGPESRAAKVTMVAALEDLRGLAAKNYAGITTETLQNIVEDDKVQSTLQSFVKGDLNDEQAIKTIREIIEGTGLFKVHVFIEFVPVELLIARNLIACAQAKMAVPQPAVKKRDISGAGEQSGEFRAPEGDGMNIGQITELAKENPNAAVQEIRKADLPKPDDIIAVVRDALSELPEKLALFDNEIKASMTTQSLYDNAPITGKLRAIEDELISLETQIGEGKLKIPAVKRGKLETLLTKVDNNIAEESMAVTLHQAWGMIDRNVAQWAMDNLINPWRNKRSELSGRLAALSIANQQRKDKRAPTQAKKPRAPEGGGMEVGKLIELAKKDPAAAAEAIVQADLPDRAGIIKAVRGALDRFTRRLSEFNEEIRKLEYEPVGTSAAAAPQPAADKRGPGGEGYKPGEPRERTPSRTAFERAIPPSDPLTAATSGSVYDGINNIGTGLSRAFLPDERMSGPFVWTCSRIDEGIIIDNNTSVLCVQFKESGAKLLIKPPADVIVYRQELYENPAKKALFDQERREKGSGGGNIVLVRRHNEGLIFTKGERVLATVTVKKTGRNKVKLIAIAPRDVRIAGKKERASRFAANAAPGAEAPARTAGEVEKQLSGELEKLENAKKTLVVLQGEVIGLIGLPYVEHTAGDVRIKYPRWTSQLQRLLKEYNTAAVGNLQDPVNDMLLRNRILSGSKSDLLGYLRYLERTIADTLNIVETRISNLQKAPAAQSSVEEVKPAPDMRAAGEKSAAKRPGKRQPGKSPEDAKIAIALSPTLKKLLETQGWFTLKDFLVGHQEAAEAHPELNWTLISEDQARTDLEALATDDGTGSVTTATVTIDKEEKAFKYSLTLTGTNAIADLELAFLRGRTQATAQAAPARRSSIESTSISEGRAEAANISPGAKAPAQAGSDNARLAARARLERMTAEITQELGSLTKLIPANLQESMLRNLALWVWFNDNPGYEETLRQTFTDLGIHPNVVDRIFTRLKAVHKITRSRTDANSGQGSALQAPERYDAEDLEALISVVKEEIDEMAVYVNEAVKARDKMMRAENPDKSLMPALNLEVENRLIVKRQLEAQISEFKKLLAAARPAGLGEFDLRDGMPIEPGNQHRVPVAEQREGLKPAVAAAVDEEASSTINWREYAHDTDVVTPQPEAAAPAEQTEKPTKMPTGSITYDEPENTAKPETIHLLIRDIIEYTVPIGLDKGPGVVKLPEGALSNLWQIVNFVHERQIKIFVPQGIGLTDNMRRALKDIETREGRKIVSEYASEIQLMQLLGNGNKADPGEKRVVITEGRSTALVRDVAENHPFVFRNVRVINMAFPEGYEDLPTGAKSFYQARMIMTGFLGGFYDKNNPTSIVGIILRGMLEGCVNVGEEGLDGFLNRMAESEDEASNDDKVRERILYCLGKTVSLLNKIAADMEQVRLMVKEFMTKL